MIRNKIRVFVIEDSKLYQMFLRRVIESDDCLTVAGVSDCGREALEMIPAVQPDIITLDLMLPDRDGLELLQELLHRFPIPVIVVSGDGGACAEAIRLGARDFIEKMQDTDPKTAEEFRLLLRLKLKMQANVPTPLTPCGEGSGQPVPQPGAMPEPPAPRSEPDAVRQSRPERGDARDHLIAVGASLGGTETTLEILRLLPDDLPGIVVVQHMPEEFTAAYAMRLDHFCGMAVREAKNGDPVLPGTVLVARGGEQLTVCRAERGYRVRLRRTERVGGFCPSVDVMFRSVAESAGDAAMGVILTGMGRDGAEGLKRMHDRGAYTLGQNRQTCAVFGMPCAAYDLGGVDKLLPPDKIAEEMIQYGLRYKKSEADKT